MDKTNMNDDTFSCKTDTRIPWIPECLSGKMASVHLRPNSVDFHRMTICSQPFQTDLEPAFTFDSMMGIEYCPVAKIRDFRHNSVSSYDFSLLFFPILTALLNHIRDKERKDQRHQRRSKQEPEQRFIRDRRK